MMHNVNTMVVHKNAKVYFRW